MKVVQSAVFVAEVEPPVAVDSENLPSDDSDVEPTPSKQEGQGTAESEDSVSTTDESE